MEPSLTEHGIIYLLLCLRSDWDREVLFPPSIATLHESPI